MSLCEISCGSCGHNSDFYEFTTTPIFGDLPPGQFQCPKCQTAIRLQAAGTLRVYQTENGEVLAFRDKIRVVVTNSVL